MRRTIEGAPSGMSVLATDDAEVFSFPACSMLNSQKFWLRSIFCDINAVGVKMDRSWRATLSPRELASLRALRRDAKREISASHRQLLLAMGLIEATGNELILTEIGNHRLDHEERRNSYREGPHPQASSLEPFAH